VRKVTRVVAAKVEMWRRLRILFQIIQDRTGWPLNLSPPR
jgi:hypothetical protein